MAWSSRMLGAMGGGAKCLEAGEHWKDSGKSPKETSLGGVEGRG